MWGGGGAAEERGHCYMCKTIILAQIVCKNILRQLTFIISSFVDLESHTPFLLYIHSLCSSMCGTLYIEPFVLSYCYTIWAKNFKFEG